MKNIILIIAPSNFRDEELFFVKEELEKANIKCTIASTKFGKCIGKLGGISNAIVSVEDIRASEYNGVIFVGGKGVLEHKLHENEIVLNLAREFNNTGKLVCAICIAPRILTRANVIQGRRVTTFPDETNIAARSLYD